MVDTQKRIIEVGIALLWMAFGAGVWIVADGYSAPLNVDPLGPSYWPKMLAGGIVLLSAVNALLVLLPRAHPQPVEVAPVPEGALVEEGPFSALHFGGLLALSVLYVLTLETLGYYLTTSLFVLTGLLLLGVRSWMKLLLPTLGLPVLWGATFQLGLGLDLPRGLFSVF